MSNSSMICNIVVFEVRSITHWSFFADWVYVVVAFQLLIREFRVRISDRLPAILRARRALSGRPRLSPNPAIFTFHNAISFDVNRAQIVFYDCNRRVVYRREM
jgi:hypothetical protein